MRAQREDGAVPGPEAREDSTIFEQLYHTTLVSALAASVRDGKGIRLDATAVLRHAEVVGVPRRSGAQLRERGDANGAKVVRDSRESAESERDGRDLVLATERAGEWLLGIVDAELGESKVSLLRLNQALVGLYCCSIMRGEDGWSEPHARIVACLAANSGGDWEMLPPLLKCAAASWTAERGFFVSPLHGRNGFLACAAAYLGNIPAKTDAAVWEMNEIWVALWHLNITSRPPEVAVENVIECVGTLGLDCQGEDLERLLLLLNAATESGTRRIEFPAAGSWIPELVAALAVGACRRYDLIEASRLLRLAISIGGEASRTQIAAERCLDYLLFNQREDGAVGILEPELRKGVGGSGEHPEKDDPSLPLTVDCLMTLALWCRDWSLIRSLGKHNEAVQAMLR